MSSVSPFDNAFVRGVIVLLLSIHSPLANVILRDTSRTWSRVEIGAFLDQSYLTALFVGNSMEY